MSSFDIQPDPQANPLTRRGLFTILQAGVAGCLACAHAAGAPQSPDPQTAQAWSEKADLTWEQIFQFAYQKDLIPLLKALSDQVGHEKFLRMLSDAGDAAVARKTAGRPAVVRDLKMFAAAMRNLPPLIQHALQAEVIEETGESFQYQVNQCLWAKVFREQNAGDLGYAMVCYPDFALARSMNPKLRLIRTETLMEGAAHCRFRYVMEG